VSLSLYKVPFCRLALCQVPLRLVSFILNVHYTESRFTECRIDITYPPPHLVTHNVLPVRVVHGGRVDSKPVDDAHRVAGSRVEDVELRDQVVGVVLVPVRQDLVSLATF